MSNDENPYEDLPDEQPASDGPKALRQAAAEGAKAKAEAEALRREMAFLKAGIDTDTKLGKLLLNSYDGELSVEAIKKEATEIGAIKVEAPAPEPFKADPADVELANARQALATGATPPEAISVDPYKAAFDKYYESAQSGSSRDNAMADAVSMILQAGAKGDARVLARPND